MCGIIGVMAFNDLPEKKQEKLRQEVMIFLSSELLQLTQSRGKDATGISTLFANCDYMGLKMGIPPTDFVARFGGTEKDFDGYLNIWRKKSVPAKMVIGHCRKSSVGNPEDNTNNHPIKIDDIVGVHNGTLTNHDKIFKLLKCERDGTVDSEAIFRLIHHLTDNGKEPFAPEIIQEVCKRLHGTYACLSFAGNNPYQMIGFRDSRPMETLLIKPLKLLLVASDKDFLKHAIFRYNKIANLYQIGPTKFPSLKKTDVELFSLPDDHLYIFDIRKDIDDASKIKDLFISERIPRIDKIWDTNASKTTGFNSYANNQVSNVSYLNKHVENKKKNKDRLGMAWNKETKLYQDVTDLKTTEAYSSVEIDSKNGKIINAETGKVLIKDNNTTHTPVNKEHKLNKVYTDLDHSVTTRAVIEELPVPTENLPSVIYADLHKNEIVVKIDSEVLEKAEIAVQKVENFTTTQEVQTALEIEKKEHLDCLTTFTLANRIKRFFYKKGWYNGYVNCLDKLKKDEEIRLSNEDLLTPKNIFIRANKKRKIAEKNIRVTKSIVHILSHVATVYGVNGGVGDVTVNNAVKKVLPGNKELDSDIIKGIFKPGDFKNMPILRKITASVTAEKQGLEI